MPLAPRFGISPKAVSGQCDRQMLFHASSRLRLGYGLDCLLQPRTSSRNAVLGAQL